MQEIWKDIKNYEGQYQISNLGNVRSLDRRVWNYNKKGRILKQYSNKGHYLYVSLNSKKHYVHILVAEAFIPNPQKYTQVNHKDFNKNNNCVYNLEWVSQAQNINRFRKSLYFKKVQEQKQIKLQNKTFEKIMNYKNHILSFYYFDGLSCEEIAKRLEIGRDFVRSVICIYEGIINELQDKKK